MNFHLERAKSLGATDAQKKRVADLQKAIAERFENAPQTEKRRSP